MILKEKIRVELEKITNESDVFVVDIKTNPNSIVIFLDSKIGIKLIECSGIHKKLYNALGEEIEKFDMQISSPGLTAPFKVLEQYKKNIEKDVQIIEKNGIQYIGKLLLVNDLTVTLQLRDKEKTIQELELSSIAKTKLIF